MLFEDGEFVFSIFIEADFTDTENIRFVDEFRDDLHYFSSESGVFGFFGVDAEPAVVVDAVFGGALWFVFCELAIVVEESLRGGAVISSPERGFAEDFTAGLSHLLVVISGTADHVAMWFNVSHRI